MRTSIKFIITIFLLSFTHDSLAQTLGFKAGYNLSSLHLKKSKVLLPDNYAKLSDYSYISGFNIGATTEFSIIKYTSLETGLLFGSRGAKRTSEDTFWPTSIITNERINLYYLIIPLSLKFPVSTGKYSFYGSFGSYFGLGLSGKIKTDLTYGELAETESANIAWGSDEEYDNFNQIDYGFTIGAGVSWKSIQIGLTYDLGIADISPDPNLGYPVSNRVLGISAAYIFGGRKKSEAAKSIPEKPKEARIATKETLSQKSSSVIAEKKSTEAETERLRIEKNRIDSINAIRFKEEQNRILKARLDSIETEKALTLKIEAEKQRISKVKTDSIEASQNSVVYKVQFLSSTSKKGSYKVTIGAKEYSTWEYLYNGAFRTTVGQFKTFKSALEFQKTVRQSGYPQAFVVAFRNNIRTTDPSLFK